MTPEQVAMISAVATLLERVGTWPIGTLIIAVCVTPWALLIWITVTLRKQQDDNAKAMRTQVDEFVKVASTSNQEFKKMYENNAELVKGFLRLSSDLHDTVVMNIRELTEMKDIAKNNQICPIVREKGRPSV
ncbi:MAG: hypothetical protein AB7E96_12140 [Deferribacterales bacterium]